jgi:hypothetical protein
VVAFGDGVEALADRLLVRGVRIRAARQAGRRVVLRRHHMPSGSVMLFSRPYPWLP